MTPSSDRPSGIFTPVPQEDAPDIPQDELLGPYGLRARLVHIGGDALEALQPTSGGPQRIGLNLFPADTKSQATSRNSGGRLDPVDLIGLLESAESDERGTTWFGRAEEDPQSELLIGDNGGVFSLSLTSARFGIFATDLFSGPANIHVLRQFNEDLLPDCGTEDADQDSDGGGEDAPEREDDGTVFDLMVIYTAAVKEALGGQAGVESRILDSYRAGNRILGNSKLTQRLNLVHMEELPNYRESGGLGGYYTMLAELVAGTAAGLEQLHTRRNEKYADIVTLLVTNPALGGLANVPPKNPTRRWGSRAYNVVNYRVAVSTYTMFHEIAHNCGCCHETGCNHAPSYARGHWFEVGGSVLKTVMVRKSVNGCRTQYLSNPKVIYPGSNPPVETGTKQRNNARVIRENARVIANFRIRPTVTSQA